MGLLKYLLGQTEDELSAEADGMSGLLQDDLGPVVTPFAKAEAAIDRASNALKSPPVVSDRRIASLPDRRNPEAGDLRFDGPEHRRQHTGDRRQAKPDFGKRTRD